MIRVVMRASVPVLNLRLLSLGHIKLLKNSEAKPLIKTLNLLVIPCALVNDGTALKPAIEFDAHFKENVGLTFPVDLKYIRRIRNQLPSISKKTILQRQLFLHLHPLDNFCYLPVAVDYTRKAGKTGQTQ